MHRHRQWTIVLILIVAGSLPPGGVLADPPPVSFAAVSYPVRGPATVAVADFDGDGKPDLAVTNFADDSVSVLRNTGDGIFAPSVAYPTSPDLVVFRNPVGLASGDFNGDGKPDLVVSNSHGVGYNPTGVSVLLNRGDGSFAPPVGYRVGTNLGTVIIGDFNGDGKADLALLGQSFSKPNFVTFLYVLLGKGDGTFADAAEYQAGTSPTSLAAGDFDGDGAPDLAVVDSVAGASVVRVLRNRGDGTFAAGRGFPVDDRPIALAAGDFDGDGAPDLVVAYSYHNAVGVLRNMGDGTFAPNENYPVTDLPILIPLISGLAVADFNGDGKLDIAATALGDGGSALNRVGILLNNGDGTFASATTYAVGGFPTSKAVGDFNGDGKVDLAVANAGSNSVSVLLNTTRAAGPVPITLAPAALPDGTVNRPYRQALTASGGTGTGYSFIVSAGALPPGLALSATGVVSGTLTAKGSYRFTVRATDSGGHTGEREYTVVIGPPIPPPVRTAG